MDPKKLIATITFIFLASSCNAQGHAFKNDEEKMLFKNTSLSLCLGMGYEGKSSYFTDQFSSATIGYREFSNISLDAYEGCRDLIKKWLKKDYKSIDGIQNIFMKCIDLSNSKELEDIFNKYDPCKTPESWFDNKEYKLRCGK
jgi:hypothetical protein